MFRNTLIPVGTPIVVAMAIAEPELGEAINIMSTISEVHVEGTHGNPLESLIWRQR